MEKFDLMRLLLYK